MGVLKILQDARYWLFAVLIMTMTLQMVVFMHARTDKTFVRSNQLETFLDSLEDKNSAVSVKVFGEEIRRDIRSIRDGSAALSDSSYKSVEQETERIWKRRSTLTDSQSQHQQQPSVQSPIAEFFDVDNYDPESNDEDDQNGSSSVQANNDDQQDLLERSKSNPPVVSEGKYLTANEDLNASKRSDMTKAVSQSSSKNKLSMSLIHSRESERRNHYNKTWIPESVIASHLMSDSVVQGVKHFLFFVGHGRGGSTNLGSLIDAHPHVVVATGYDIFRKWLERPAYHQNRSVLYTSLLLRSNIVTNVYQKTKGRDNSLYIDNSFMGRCNHSIQVIGENEAGSAASMFHISSEKWAQTLSQMKRTVGVPIKVIQTITNPFDNIATMVMFDLGAGPSRHSGSSPVPVSNSELVDFRIRSYFRNALAVSRMRSDPSLGLDLYQVHLEDLLHRPHDAMEGICQFLGIPCYDWYLETCQSHMGHVFKDISKSREKIVWSESQISKVLEQIKQFPWLKQYNFTSL